VWDELLELPWLDELEPSAPSAAASSSPPDVPLLLEQATDAKKTLDTAARAIRLLIRETP
jgi:hypothetical protein